MESSYELNINPNVMCRICLAENDNMKSIFCNEIVNGEIVPFPKVFETVTGIPVILNNIKENIHRNVIIYFIFLKWPTYMCIVERFTVKCDFLSNCILLYLIFLYLGKKRRWIS